MPSPPPLFQAAALLQKKHASQSKAYDRKMKKLSIKDETVQEAMRLNAKIDEERKSTADKKLVKKLEKEARQTVVLNGAKAKGCEGHVANNVHPHLQPPSNSTRSKLRSLPN